MLGAPGNFEPNPSQAKDAELLATQFSALQGFLFPFPGMKRAIRFWELAREREHQPNGQLGDGNSVGTRRVHHHDSAARRSIGIDVINAYTGSPNDAQAGRGLQQRIIDLNRRADDERVSIGQLRSQPILDLVVSYNFPVGLAMKDR
jgi:hypothetical protein